MLETKQIIELVQDYISTENSDVVLYSGPIIYARASDFVDMLCKKQAATPKPKPTVLFFLTTPGGDPHAAYRMIRALRIVYKNVRLCVVGPCKSAGTLISLGAHELVMSDTGELGPLDVQLAKPDEIITNSSGLDVFQALAVATTNAFDTLERCMLDIVEHSGGSISTKTAAEIATSFAVGLFAPLMAQIDPDRLGEIQRAIKIANAYGERIGSTNLHTNAMDKLVEGYPSHGFVIDREEAKKLYKKVTPLTEKEQQIGAVFQGFLRHITNQAKFLDVGVTFSHPTPEQKNGTKPNGARSKPNLPSSSGVRKTNGPHARVAVGGRANGTNGATIPRAPRSRNGTGKPAARG